MQGPRVEVLKAFFKASGRLIPHKELTLGFCREKLGR